MVGFNGDDDIKVVKRLKKRPTTITYQHDDAADAGAADGDVEVALGVAHVDEGCEGLSRIFQTLIRSR